MGILGGVGWGEEVGPEQRQNSPYGVVLTAGAGKWGFPSHWFVVGGGMRLERGPPLSPTQLCTVADARTVERLSDLLRKSDTS